MVNRRTERILIAIIDDAIQQPQSHDKNKPWGIETRNFIFENNSSVIILSTLETRMNTLQNIDEPLSTETAINTIFVLLLSDITLTAGLCVLFLWEHS